MRKTAILLLVAFSSLRISAQDDLYLKIKDILVQRYPGIVTSDKLIAVSFSSPDDAVSREANRAFDKAFHTFRVAKLRGGTRGMIAVTIVRSASQREAEIAVSGDGLSEILPLGEQYFREPARGVTNLVFDAGGREVYRDLAVPEIYSSIQKLITR